MKKILHFEDEEMLANMYKSRFEKEGFQYQSYSYPPEDKEELINLILAEKPDLILTNILMPVMDGFAVTKVLKSDDRTKNIPIFALTNLGQKEDIKTGMDLGMTDYFVRANSTPAELIEKLKKYKY